MPSIESDVAVPRAGPPLPRRGRGGWWRRARDIAERTPETRNRYVDFLRAASIVVVVVGHWMMAAPSIHREAVTLSDILFEAPWTQWLTWVFQVMPLFFIVGGYANAASLSAYRRTGHDYAAWVSVRLKRLVGPLVPLLLVWLVLAATARWLGLSERMVAAGSTIAFVPLWFLAVYVLVVLVAPLTHALWLRYDTRSFWALVLAAVAIETLATFDRIAAVQWLNYAVVWLAFHQFGHAWRHGAAGGASRSLGLAVAGFVGLLGLRFIAGYPVSMVTVPGDPASNTNPPSLALLALGLTHGGLVLAAEQPARRWLERARVWTATVFVNGMILTVYLWHATAMVLLIALLEGPGGIGLAIEPGSAEWWLTRPLWIAMLLLLLMLTVAAFARFEALRPGSRDRPPAAWRSVAATVAVSGALIWLAARGISTSDGPGINVVPVVLALSGALWIMGAGRSARTSARR